MHLRNDGKSSSPENGKLQQLHLDFVYIDDADVYCNASAPLRIGDNTLHRIVVRVLLGLIITGDFPQGHCSLSRDL